MKFPKYFKGLSFANKFILSLWLIPLVMLFTFWGPVEPVAHLMMIIIVIFLLLQNFYYERLLKGEKK